MFHKVIHLTNEIPDALKLFKKAEVLNLVEVRSRTGCYIAQCKG